MRPIDRVSRFVDLLTLDHCHTVAECQAIANRRLNRMRVFGGARNAVVRNLSFFGESRPDDLIFRGFNVSARDRLMRSAYREQWDRAYAQCRMEGRQVIVDIENYRQRVAWREHDMTERHVSEAKKLINQVKRIYRETSTNHG